MIKFFRNIRRQLLSENRIGKYLLYAIGEILLVVIGILIALQINNWNEHRKARAEEKTILKVLQTDFEYNLDVFNRTVAMHQSTLEACDVILRNMGSSDQQILLDSVAGIGHLAFRGTSYDSHNGMVESLINSGSIKVISNDTLRNYLISWKNVLEDYKEEERLGVDYFKNIVEQYLLENIDFFEVSSPRSLKTASDPKFRNMVIRQRSYTQGVLDAAENEPIRLYMTEIIRLTNTSSD